MRLNLHKFRQLLLDTITKRKTSINKAAVEMGLHPSILYNMFSRKRSPEISANTMAAILRWLNLPLSFVFPGYEPPASTLGEIQHVLFKDPALTREQAQAIGDIVETLYATFTGLKT